jgi:hypothetical protein
LISRDYLERDKENPNMFKYMAWCNHMSHLNKWSGCCN